MDAWLSVFCECLCFVEVVLLNAVVTWFQACRVDFGSDGFLLLPNSHTPSLAVLKYCTVLMSDLSLCQLAFRTLLRKLTVLGSTLGWQSSGIGFFEPTRKLVSV